MDISDEDSVGYVLANADHAIQYGEDVEPKDFEVGVRPFACLSVVLNTCD